MSFYLKKILGGIFYILFNGLDFHLNIQQV